MVPWANFAAAFNRRRWFEAHEIMESHWVEDRSEHRDFLQGMIQVAVCLHHAQRGNRKGAEGVARSARRRLSRYRPEYRGVDVATLLEEMDRTVRDGGAPPTIPERLRGGSR